MVGHCVHKHLRTWLLVKVIYTFITYNMIVVSVCGWIAK